MTKKSDAKSSKKRAKKKGLKPIKILGQNSPVVSKEK